MISTSRRIRTPAQVAMSVTVMAVLVVGYSSTPSGAQQLEPAQVRVAPRSSIDLPHHSASVPPQEPVLETEIAPATGRAASA
jgi:hypothetical protein